MTIEQANEYFSSLPEGFAPAEELRAALTADVQKVQFVGVAGTAGKTAAAGLLAAILREAAFHVGFYRAGCEPLSARIAIGGVSVDPVLLCQAAEALSAAKPLPREAAELAAAARCFGAAGCKLAVAVARETASALDSEKRHLLAIASALSFSPAVIVADEPTKGLDEVASAHVAKALFSYDKQVVFATHDTELITRAEYAIDRTLVVDDHQVVFDGDPHEAVAFYTDLIRAKYEASKA